MKKPRLGLFGRIVIAICCGVGLGFLCAACGGAGDVCVRILKTFNVLFAQILKFIVPLLILGLVTPAISDVGRGAGKLLLTVMVLSYFSTVSAGFFAYGCAGELLPHAAAPAVAVLSVPLSLTPRQTGAEELPPYAPEHRPRGPGGGFAPLRC